MVDDELPATYLAGQASNSVLELAGPVGLDEATLHHRRIRTVAGLDDHTGIEPVVTWMPLVRIRNLFAL